MGGVSSSGYNFSVKLFWSAPLLVLLFLSLPAVGASKPPQPVIVCFGDSLTAGYGADPGHAYPDYLQQLLDARGYHYHVLNKGISGDTTKDGVARLQDVLAVHPAIAVVEFGGNDGLRGLPITATRANLDQMIATLQSAGVKVALAGITLPPDYGQDYIRDFNDTFTLAATKYKVPLLPFLYVHVYDIPGAIQQDKTHATAKGNELVAENVFGLVRPLLKK
jgi:acyl-CoA thioesterase-1